MIKIDKKKSPTFVRNLSRLVGTLICTKYFVLCFGNTAYEKTMKM